MLMGLGRHLFGVRIEVVLFEGEHDSAVSEREYEQRNHVLHREQEVVVPKKYISLSRAPFYFPINDI